MNPVLPPEDVERSIDTALATELTQTFIDDNIAKSLVKTTFDHFSQYRTNNHDPRWISHDALYFGFVAPKVWTGTNIPRANLGQSLVFAKVETAVPSIMQSLFYTGGEIFQVQAENPAQKDAAVQWQNVMSYIFEHPNNQFGATVMQEFLETIRQMCLYGNGGVRLLWDPVKGVPTVESVDIRDFYIDPLTSSPSVDGARSVIERRIVPIDKVHEWIVADKRYRQLSLEALQALAAITPSVTADTTKRMQEAYRAVNFDPGYQNWIPNPAERCVEILTYYSPKKIIYLINRHTVLYNEPNPYGFIPLCFAPCFPVPGRFYAQSIADVVEGFQRGTEALWNGRLDEISLALHPPRSTTRDSAMTPGNQKWYPGATIMSDATQSKNSLMQPATTLTNVFGDIQALGVQSDLISGISGNVPRPSNANRTAGGMQMQADASSMRLLPVVLAFEYYLFVPLLYKLYKMLRMHTSTESTLPGLNADKESYRVPGDIITKECQFRMLAATRMLTQARLAEIVPFLLQSMMQGPVINGLAAANLTIDYPEFARMIQSATGTEKMFQLVRPLNEQELAQKNQPPPEVLMQQQSKQADLQTRKELMAMKNEAAKEVAMIAKSPDPSEQQREAQRLQMEQAMASMKLQYEQAMNAAKLAAKQEETQQKLQAKRYETALKAQAGEVDLALKREQSNTMLAEAQQKSEISRAAGFQQLSLKQLAAEAQLKNDKARKKEKSKEK